MTDKKLFYLSWFVYFATYLGRLNYTAGLLEFMAAEGFTKAEAGLIGTGFFCAYGVSQFICGIVGDKLAPGKLVFWGTLLSGCINLLFAVAGSLPVMLLLWVMNGIVQAFIWSPLLRNLAEYLPEEIRSKYCIRLNTTVPAGTMAAYLMTAAAIFTSGWRLAFWLAGVILIAAAFIWLAGIRYCSRRLIKISRAETGPEALAGVNWKRVFRSSGLTLLFPALMIQGSLKDGVTAWVPVYISEIYHLGQTAAIVSTIVIPVCNLAGVYLASAMFHRLRSELKTSSFFFAVCGIAFILLYGTSGRNLILSYLLLAVGTTAMMAVNTMLIALFPVNFAKTGRVALLSGILNSFVYLGGAVSTYGIGYLAGQAGWAATILLWMMAAVAAAVLCLGAEQKWKRGEIGR